MDLERALADDILAVLPQRSSARPFVSVYSIIDSVAPLRDKEVRAAIRGLVKRGFLDVNPGGHYWPAYYARKPIRRI
jgi:hypothetical protein